MFSKTALFKKLIILSMMERTKQISNIRMYSHNLSGARAKIYQINDNLIYEFFDVYSLQETWFNQEVLDSEVIASSNYDIIRNDRSFGRRF